MVSGQPEVGLELGWKTVNTCDTCRESVEWAKEGPRGAPSQPSTREFTGSGKEQAAPNRA